MKRWQNVSAIYQIYPRSFKDANNDGTGDLKGIIQKLDYLNGKNDSLGVNAIWLSPFYQSPMADFGYDISDYCAVDPIFGTMDDFDELVAQAHRRNIKVMIDYVPNHTSDQHEWFKQSRSSRDNAKRDWYVWKDAKADGSPPNNWLGVFGGSAWEWDEQTNQYYLHSFLAKQPDLNWENPEVREAMKDVLHFWFKKGVDGIRVDAVRWIAKDVLLRDNPPNPDFVDGEDPYHAQLQKYTRYGDQLFRHVKEITDVVASYDDRIAIFENYPDKALEWKRQYMDFYEVNPEVSAPFNFDGIKTKYDIALFRRFINKYQSEIVGNKLRPFYSFGNHDKPRMVSRVGALEARLLAVLLMTLPGTPFMYYGDEIGMPNGHIPPDKIQDPFEKLTPNLGLGRDPMRTPMQWSDAKNAGFSDVEPWLPVQDNYHEINVEAEQTDSNSFLSMYTFLIKLRQEEVFKTGTYSEWNGCTDELFGFFRRTAHDACLVLLNMSPVAVKCKEGISGTVIFGTQGFEGLLDGKEFILKSSQAIIVRLTKK